MGGITLAPPPGQPLSATLTTLASSTAAGLALMDDADATAQRVTLGLVIGTNVQAFDADLADIAAIADVQGDIMVRGAAGWERLAKSATATDVLTAGASQPAWAAPTGGGSVATDAIWNAAGDLAVGTGPDTAARLGIGTALQVLRVNAGVTALEWATIGALTDGDKGDITVSGSGAAWAIDNDVVTNAKAANMATATIKGRLTAATGDPEDLTQTQARQVLALTPGTDVQAFSAVLAATTASFLTTDETKLDGIEALADVTDAANVNAAGAVMESDYNANTVLAATADNTPLPITMGASTILARLASGDIIASTPSQMRTLLTLVPGTDVQAFDADLLAIAGLTSAANKGIQFTGSGTAGTYDLTTAGKALLDDADATAQRVTLGLVIGTDVQAQDAELAAIAGLTSAADRLPYFTGLGTAALATFTAFARTLLDDATAATALTTLGAAALAGPQTISGVLTLSSDPLIPDEAYGAPWNGVMEPPTKNAIYDKIESLAQLDDGVRTTINASVPGFLGVDVLLSGGIAGGDTLIGGTASGDDLTIGSTVDATRGTIFLRDQVELVSEDKTNTTTTPYHVLTVPSTRTLTMDCNTPFAGNTFRLINLSASIVFDQNSATAAVGLLRHGATIKNTSGVAVTLGASTTLSSTPTYTADAAAVSVIHNGVIDGPIFGVLTTGTLAPVSTGFQSGATVNAGVTVGTRTGFKVLDSTGAGTVTLGIGIDIDAMSDAATSIGIRLASTFVRTPTANANITAVSATIAHTAALITLTANNSYTLTSTPTITDGVDGEELVIMNVDTADTITIQDQGTLAGSNLRLMTTTVALSPRDSIRLVYNATVGDWVQVTPLATVI